MNFKNKIYELKLFEETEHLNEFTIDYYLVEHHNEDLFLHKTKSYGILLEKRYKDSDLVETNTVANISSKRDSVVELIQLIYKNSVTTIGLDDLIYDLI